jgi:hypothetical protein
MEEKQKSLVQLQIAEKVNSILGDTSKLESTEKIGGDTETRTSDRSTGLTVAREIIFSPGEVDLLTGPPPKQGGFVGADPSQIADNLNSTADDTIKLESTEKKAEDVTIRTSDGSASLTVAREIDFSPGDSGIRKAPPPEQGSFVGATPSEIADHLDSTASDESKLHVVDSPEKKGKDVETSYVLENEAIGATTPSSPVVEGITAARELNFASSEMDLAPDSASKQDGFVEASPAEQSEMMDVPMEDVEIAYPVEREATIVPTVEGDNLAAATEVDLNAGVGSDLSSAPPQQNSLEGANSADFSEIALTLGAENSDPSEETGQENAGANANDDPHSKSQNENEEGQVASAVDTSSNDADATDNAVVEMMDVPMEDVDISDPVEREATIVPTAEGDNLAAATDVDLNSGVASDLSSALPKQSSLEGANSAEFSEIALTVGAENSDPSEETGQENAGANTNDVPHLESQNENEEGQFALAVDTSSNDADAANSAVFVGDIYECGKGEGLKTVETVEEVQDNVDADDIKAFSQGEDAEKAENVPATAENDMTDIVLESVETGHDDIQSFRPNESILAMEALLEAALTNNLDPPEENVGAVVQDANVADVTSCMEQATNFPEESSANADDNCIVGSDATESTGEVGDPVTDIPKSADTAKVDKSIRDIEELLDSALTDAFYTSEDGAPEGVGTRGADDAISATTTEDTYDFLASASIARIEATLNLGLDDDIDLDALMFDSPRKSTEDQQNHVVSLTDDQNASLSDLLDNALDDEFEINFAEEPKSKSKDISGGPGGKAATAKTTSSTRSGVPKAAQKRGAASKSSRGSAAQPRKETRPAARTSNRANQAAPKVGPRGPATQPKKQNRSKAADRSSQPGKKAGPRSLLSGRFSSKPKESAKAVDSAKPKSREVTKATEEKNKAARKKGAARKLMSRMTSWTTKKELESTTSADDARVPGVPTNSSRQPKTRPTPVALFRGSKAASSNESKTNTQRDTPVAGSSEALAPDPEPESTVKTAPLMMTPPRPASAPTASSVRSITSLSSQCSVVSFSSPRREGRRGCQSKFQPFLHESRGPCELCVFFLSDDDKVMLDTTGRHIRVMFTSGGCCKTCEIFPREFDEPAVRLCRQCFFNTHREIYSKVAPKRRLLRKKL